jgi:hypothetical protein
MRAVSLGILSFARSKWGKAIVFGSFVCVLVPSTAGTAQAARWCRQTATWVGQNGWQGANPNFEVWFRLDVGRHQPYYIYLGNNYVGPNRLWPQRLVNGTTRFGIDTTWALQQRGWLNRLNWTIDYAC